MLNWCSLIDFVFSLLGGLAVMLVTVVVTLCVYRQVIAHRIDVLIREEQDYAYCGNNHIIEICRSRILLLKKLKEAL
jgi:hypothetical protein